MGWFWTSSAPLATSRADAKEGSRTEAQCPVDHAARSAWLEQAREQRLRQPSPPPLTQLSGEGCDSSRMEESLSSFMQPAVPPLPAARLGTERVVSSIPRASSDVTDTLKIPANSEKESPRDKSGRWIYPSEAMFFEAMRRKSHDPRTEDMAAIVPIHNAVNERAWNEICEWERGRGSEKCGGPKLYSFSGSGSQNMTPRARINTLLGYTAPFDRHDWIVDRCGQKVDYVIDFYSGRDEGKPGKSLNFYLDVRPKLNSWEGWKMRIEKVVGL